MREIKFRAWDKRAKELFNVVQICYSGRGIPFAYAKGEKHPRSEVELMQYTGLKDKNGVEIFEGDIVQCEKEEWYRTAVVIGSDISEEPEYREVVEWDYGLLDMRKNDYPAYWEVIGNIYEHSHLLENPELLNAK